MGSVTAVMMDVITEKSGHSVTPLAVSVCITPAAPSPLPMPYPVVAQASEGVADEAMRTKIDGSKVATVGSVLKSCHGNEPGTMKEVLSLNTSGPCFLVMGAPVVLVELGMMGITGSPCFSNKAITVGGPSMASGAGGTGGAGGGGGGGGGSGGNASGSQGPSGGGGAGGGGSNTGASGPGGSSGAAGEHQCVNGHPVDVVTGYVVDAATDISLPGMIPFEWKRTYSSSRRADKTATLGRGWAHGFEQQITEEEGVITLRDPEGRSIWFAKIKPGESTFHRRERMTLHRDGEDAYRVERLADRLTYVFGAGEKGGRAQLRAIEDAWGNTLSLHYEGARLTKIVDTAGREIRVRWKESRIVRLEVHAEGRLELWYDYAYSTSGCLISATDALGFADEFEYDRHHRMTSTTLKTGAKFEYEYEADTGRCKKTWGPKGLYAIELELDVANKTTYVHGEEPQVVTWNDQGTATRIATPDGMVLEETAWDQDGLLIARVNGAGEGEQTWYDERGNRVRVVDAMGGETRWEIGPGDLPVRRIDPDERVTELGYDAHGALTSIVYPSGETHHMSYDSRGRMIAASRFGVTIRAYEYDHQHEIVAETDARGARSTYTYDALGRPLSHRDALGRVTTVSYDRLGHALVIRYPDGSTLQRAYDGRGKVIREIDALGRKTELERIGMGVVTKLVHPDGGVWSMSYTSKERLREIKNPNGETYRFERNQAGYIVEEKTFEGRVMKYDWAPSGQLARVTHADDSYRAFTYDRAGRLVREEASDGSVASFQRDKMGRLMGAALEEGGRRIVNLFERDRAGRVVTERQGDRVVRYAYDQQNRRVGRVMPDGSTTRYAYDAEDDLIAIEHGAHQLSFQRDALGRETSRADGRGLFSVQRVYDAVDRLIEQRATAPSPGGDVPATLAQRQWRYDRGGQVTRIDDGRFGATKYGYDGAGQLLFAEQGGVRESFSYDRAGSLVAELEAMASKDSKWKIGPGNQLLQTGKHRYSHDARGRRTGRVDRASGAVTEYRWDARDRLREVKRPDGTVVRMTYDAFGRRVQKEVTSPMQSGRSRVVDFVWDGNALAADIDSEHGARTFVHWPQTLEPLLQAERGEVLTYVNDHLGTPKELIDAGGRVVWAARHSAWGRVVEVRRDPQIAERSGRPTSSPFRLIGQYEDEETGLCATLFRLFDPEVGRWLSPDPIGLEGSRNLFAFEGSPTCSIDPLGLSTDGHHEDDQKKPKQIYNSLKSAPEYPEGFKPKQGGTTKNNIKDKELLANLREQHPGEWKKVYKDGWDSSGKPVSVHYFEHQSGKVFNVKTKPGWSNS